MSSTAFDPTTYDLVDYKLLPVAGMLKEEMKEMFYLTTHSTHFILRLYGVGQMVKDHSDSESGNPLPPYGLLFPINSKGSFICTIPQTGYTYHGLCYTSRGTLAGTRNSSIAQHLLINLHLAPIIADQTFETK